MGWTMHGTSNYGQTLETSQLVDLEAHGIFRTDLIILLDINTLLTGSRYLTVMRLGAW